MADMFTWSPRVGATGADRFKWPNTETFINGASTLEEFPTLSEVNASDYLIQIINAINWFVTHTKTTALKITTAFQTNKATDLQKIITAIDQIRIDHDLSSFSWTDSTLTSDDLQTQTMVEEMRTAITINKAYLKAIPAGKIERGVKASGTESSATDAYNGALADTPSQQGGGAQYVGQGIVEFGGGTLFGAEMRRVWLNLDLAEIFNESTLSFATIQAIIEETEGARTYTVGYYKSDSYVDLEGSYSISADLWSTHTEHTDTLLGSKDSDDLEADEFLDLDETLLDLDTNYLLTLAGTDDVSETEPTPLTNSIPFQLAEWVPSTISFKVTF